MMCKPLWKDAPDWANFMAQDRDGCWCWFEKCPKLITTMWRNPHGKYATIDVDNWEDSLQERPVECKLEGSINLSVEFEPGGLELLEETLSKTPGDVELQEVFDRAPDWAIILCQDADGDWFAYDIIPEYSNEFGYWVIPDGQTQMPNMYHIGTTSVLKSGAFAVRDIG